MPQSCGLGLSIDLELLIRAGTCQDRGAGLRRGIADEVAGGADGWGADIGALDDDEVTLALLGMITRSGLSLAQLPRVHADTSRRAGPNGVELGALPRPAQPRPASNSSWIELRCLGRQGRVHAGARLRVWSPDGLQRTVELDANATARIEDIAEPGTCRVELLRAAATSVRSDDRPAPNAAVLRVGGEATALRTGAVHLLIIEEPYRFSA